MTLRTASSASRRSGARLARYSATVAGFELMGGLLPVPRAVLKAARGSRAKTRRSRSRLRCSLRATRAEPRERMGDVHVAHAVAERLLVDAHGPAAAPE